jgi:hypothetical protein
LKQTLNISSERIFTQFSHFVGCNEFRSKSLIGQSAPGQKPNNPPSRKTQANARWGYQKKIKVKLSQTESYLKLE